MKLIDILVQELPKRGGWPEGADHIATNGYWRVFAYWVGSSLKGIDLNIESDAEGYVTREQYEAALAASKPEWDDEGLPTVGCNFEYMASSGMWFIAKMKYCGKSFAIVDIDGSESWMSLNQEMRPIRSEADKKKETVEKAIADALFKDGDFDYAEALRISTFVYGAMSRKEIPHIRID